MPWLLALDASPRLAHALGLAWAMSVAFTAAVFSWFGAAIGGYTQWGEAAGVLGLLLAAPLFQPQFLAFALVRHLVGLRRGRLLRACAAAAAWAAAEWLLPRLLGDTLGHGLQPARLLRQGADLAGTAGLTLLLLLANEGVAAAVARRGAGVRAMAAPLALAAALPLLLAGYGAAVLAVLDTGPPPGAQPLRIALVQANIVGYERLRRERGAYAVVREVLDTHFAMSHDAVERQRADAVLWSETVYPTTFASPKSEDGRELDREILDVVEAAGVPFVFGTYERDAAGEYNAAAFVAPGAGLLGFYRKTRVFPLTEHVPAWLDGPLLRRWLPWAGSWQPGSGARVFPLRLADGREVPVLPMICLDDVDTGLGIAGARLGAQAILTLSNDAWFSGRGARLHLAAAAFRSIETRLPQFRVTTHGVSAVIGADGSLLAAAPLDTRTLVVGQVPVAEPRRTLIVAWGDWVGPAATAFLALLAAGWALRALRARRGGAAGASRDPAAAAPAAAPGLPAELVVLPPSARVAAALLRGLARGSLLAMGAAVLLGLAAQANPLTQLRLFAALVLAPEFAAWSLLRAFRARASVDGGVLVLTRGAQRLELALREVVAVRPWRLPVPCAGAALQLRSGGRWPHGLALPDPRVLQAVVASAAGGPLPPASLAATVAQARAAVPRSRLDRPWLKFVAFPLLLALPAFRLHQHIAYGGSFGEAYTYGLAAYLATFAIWWAEWAMGVLLWAAALRAVIEAGALLAAWLRPALALAARRWLERLGLAALYLGLPALLALRIGGG